MLFKLSYSIRNFNIQENEELFTLEDSGVEVRLYKPSEIDSKERMINTTFCDAIIEKEPKDKNFEILKKIAERRPLGFGDEEIEGYSIVNNIISKDEHSSYTVPTLKSFPEYFKTFYNEIHDNLDNSVKTVINNIKWIYNYNGSNKPFGSVDFYFSFDGQIWEWMPFNNNVTVLVGELYLRINEVGRKLICSKDTNVPIHHSLFLEAWGQRRTNERSSLVMGLAALEGAIKYMIIKNVPDSKWIVENSPSPSVHSMLTSMLKELPIKNKIEEQIKSPSKETMDNFKKWINVRNQLVHKGSHLPKSFVIEDILKEIKSIIYLMDYYSGQEWAIQNVYKKTIES